MGVGGFIAPKHLKAIKEVGGILTSAVDLHDSVGILDSYFPDAHFFTETERFERHLRKHPVDYLVVCTPNYLRDAHVWLGLNVGSKVICEKPLVVNPWNLKPLINKDVNVILQLRLNPEIQKLKGGDVVIDYIAPRGRWYYNSWKADVNKSGGLIYNIGIHFIDILCWLYGRPTNINILEHSDRFIAGEFRFKNAFAKWKLSTEGTAKKHFTVNGETIDLSNDFCDLHTESYREILAGRGFKPKDVRVGIETAHKIKEICTSPTKQV